MSVDVVKESNDNILSFEDSYLQIEIIRYSFAETFFVFDGESDKKKEKVSSLAPSCGANFDGGMSFCAMLLIE